MNHEEILKDIQEKQLKEVMISQDIDELKKQGACFCQKLQDKREIYHPHIRPGKYYKLLCDFCALKEEFKYDADVVRKKMIEEELYGDI